MNNTVTAIIPTLNERPDMLKEAVESVKNQTVKVDNIVVVDFIDNEPGNCARRLNYGVKKFNTDFFFFMGDDDILMPNFVERMLHEMNKNGNIDIVSSFFENFGDDTGVHGPEKFPLCSTFVRRRIYDKTKGYDETIPIGLDADFYFQCFEANAQWVIIPDVLYKYRIHKNQISKTGSWLNYKELIDKKYNGKYSHI